MKRMIIFLIVLFTISICKSNPIIPPPAISEIYFDSTKWYIELNCFGIDFSQTNVRLISSTDTAYLPNYNINSGYIDQALVITQDSLSTLFNINRNSDYLEIQIYYGSWQSMNIICWGSSICSDYYESFVDTPKIGQSLVMTRFRYGSYGNFSYQYWLVKDSIPTIGYIAYQTNTLGKFCGYILDNQNIPIQNIRLQYCSQYYMNGVDATLTPITTNNIGYFNKENMFCKKYNITFCYNYPPYNKIIDTSIVISIEPDSINCYEFVLDTTLTNVKSIANKSTITLNAYPNPSNGNTTIVFDIPDNYQFSEALMKIYNSTGEIVRILPISSTKSIKEFSIVWDGINYNKNSIESGVFICTLQLDGKKVAERKIIISK